MSDIKKLYEAFDLLLNEEDEASSKAMHDYIVGLARKINEEFEDAELEEADLDYDMENDATDDIESDMDEISSEEGFAEEDDEDDFGGEEAFDDLETDMEGGEVGEEDLEGRVMELEDALEQLQSEFDRLSDVESDEHGDDFGGDDEGDFSDDFDSDDEGDFSDDFDSDDEGDFSDDEDDFGSEESFEDEDEFNMSESVDDEDDDDDDDTDELDESVELKKVSAPSNKEGSEVGKGSSFQVNSKSIAKPQGNLKPGNAKAVMSKGGEAKGYSPPKNLKVKDMNAPDNTVSGKAKSSQKKVAAPSKNQAEVGKGKSVPDNAKSLIQKKVR